MARALVKFDPNQPMRDITVLTTLTREQYYDIGCSFPDPELNEEQRVQGCQAYCDQFIAYVHTAKDPSTITNCYSETIIEFVRSCVSLDLPITRSLGLVAAVPFKNCLTLMIQYQGLSELILRSQAVTSLQSQLVYKGDEFQPIYGTTPSIIHIPNMSMSRKWEDITHAYTIANFMHGPCQPEVMNIDELELVHKMSKMPDGPAWKYNKPEMHRKAPTRRIAKRLRKLVGGPAQIALTRGLQIEDSQFDHSRLGRYKELDTQRAREQLEIALTSSDKPLPLPEPLPDRPAGWIEALGQTKKSLWVKIQELRAKQPGLTSTEWIEQVMFAMSQADELTSPTSLDNPDDIEAVWDAVVNKKQFTLDTADRIPDDL